MPENKNSVIDVICQHSYNGDIIPLRIRFHDNEGELQSYTIKSYRDLSGGGCRTLEDGRYITNHIRVFECRISVFGKTELTRLYYDMDNNHWSFSV
ncbi:MAG: hypothetical protein J6N76_07855 [Lachnospiraceae bacterium]|nr:hypothetical protein [Lachnospiraceae bacterium]